MLTSAGRRGVRAGVRGARTSGLDDPGLCEEPRDGDRSLEDGEDDREDEADPGVDVTLGEELEQQHQCADDRQRGNDPAELGVLPEERCGERDETGCPEKRDGRGESEEQIVLVDVEAFGVERGREAEEEVDQAQCADGIGKVFREIGGQTLGPL